MMPLQHTFAILAYRESPYLEECILSLMRQTIPSRIILSTSTPSDFLEQTASKYGISLALNSKRRSISDDWSFAYNAASSQFVTLAHQDDLYLPGYTEHCLQLADQYPDWLITFTDYDESLAGKIRVHNANLVIKRLIVAATYRGSKSLRSESLKKALLCFGSPIPCPSVMFNRSNIGAFEFSEAFSINLDWDAWIRLAERKGSFLFVKRRLVTHRLHQDSQTSSGLDRGNRRAEDNMLFARLWPSSIARILTNLYSLSYASNRCDR